jgi:hypothetical protein
MERDAHWDFVAVMDSLLALQSSADAWRRWDELHEAAETLVATARASGPEQLHSWLDAHATALVGQQLLVRSVHRDRDAGPEMDTALRAWMAEAGSTGSAADAVAWLQREEPALLRSWLLGHLTELVDRELERIRPTPYPDDPVPPSTTAEPAATSTATPSTSSPPTSHKTDVSP